MEKNYCWLVGCVVYFGHSLTASVNSASFALYGTCTFSEAIYGHKDAGRQAGRPAADDRGIR